MATDPETKRSRQSALIGGRDAVDFPAMDCRISTAWMLGAMLFLSPAAAPAAKLDDAIDAVLRDPYLKNVDVGVKIVKLGDKPESSAVLFEHRATTPLTPASNLKLITTAAALDTLGADFRFRTVLAQKGDTIALIGDGDPTFGDAELLKKFDWTSTTLVQKWAEALVERGTKTAAQFVYDDSIFDDRFVHPSWPENQIHLRYVAGVCGLNFNANCIDFYVKPNGTGALVDYTLDPPTTYATVSNGCVQGTKDAVWLSRKPGSNEIQLRGETRAANTAPISVTVADPGLFAATTVRDVLNRHGMAIAGEVKRDPTVRASMNDWQVLAVHETPIEQVLARANKDSMNLYAESLCKRLGAKASGEAGSWANGTAATGKFLQSIGIPAEQFSLDDGCGLSRKNTIAPAAIVAVLQHEHFAKHRDVYFNSLAVAGVDGTLDKRFEGTPLRQRVHAKSGFIDHVSSLSGYLVGRDGELYAFSIMFNGIASGTNATAKKLQERIVMALEP
jgi:D-alanyl-D-alanine carboxypeptidase/D-alanyl-D-alanine-endopeptidase (penicillin-binding protein 4)